VPAQSAKSARIPKYCLHKPTGCAYVRVRGRMIYPGKWGSPESREKYGRAIAKSAVVPLAPISA